MVKRIVFSGLVLIFLGVATAVTLKKHDASPEPTKWGPDTPVAVVLENLGYELKNKRAAQLDEEKVRMGEELIVKGWTVGPDGKRTKRQSRYYVCTNCHNQAQEDPDLRQSDADARFDYCREKGIPLLQGTTFYGQMNRESWYNDDYDKKYGDLVKPARESIDGALHLCATVCSQGRDFTDWELEAVKEYLWSIDYKLSDLALTKEDYQRLNKVQGKDVKTAEWLKSFYLDYSPASFVEGPENHHEGYSGLTGDAERGREVYAMACLACHNPEGPSEYLKLDHSSLSKGLLRRNIEKHHRFSIYHVVRHGTYPFPGHKPYMPHYTAQRMSDQQIEDLRAYVEQ